MTLYYTVINFAYEACFTIKIIGLTTIFVYKFRYSYGKNFCKLFSVRFSLSVFFFLVAILYDVSILMPLFLFSAAIRAEETAKGGIKYELVLSEPSSNDPPKKDQLTSPPKTMSVEEIEQKLKAAEERRLVSYNEPKGNLKTLSRKMHLEIRCYMLIFLISEHIV